MTSEKQVAAAEVITALLNGELLSKDFDRIFKTFPSTRPACIVERGRPVVRGRGTPASTVISIYFVRVENRFSRREFQKWLKKSTDIDCMYDPDSVFPFLFEAYKEQCDALDVIDAMRRDA
jgi:hypothetical protein